MMVTDTHVGSVKRQAFAGLIIAAAMLTLWFGMGVGGTLVSPVVMLPEATQAQGTGQSSDGLEAAQPVPEAKIQKRERIEEVGPMREGILIGQVFDPDGNPVAGAVVVLLVLGPDGPDENLMAKVKTGAVGRFEIEPPSEMRGRDLILIARHDGFRPACVPFQIDPAVRQHDIELHLELGYSIEGRVVRHGEPVRDATILGNLRLGIPGVKGMDTGAFWIDGRLEEQFARTTTDDSGSFHLSGLGPHEHSLVVRGRLNDTRFNHQEHVRAPTTGLEIDLTPAEIEIRIRQSGNGSRRTWILVRYGDQQIEERSNADQPTLFEVPAGAEVQISFHDDMSEVVKKTVTAPAAGSKLYLDLDLTSVERPGIRLHLVGARERGLEHIQARILGGGVDTERSLAIDPKSDSYSWVAVRVPPGGYQLVVGPREQGPGQYLLEFSKPIVLSRAGVLDVQIDLRPGGLFDLNLDPRKWQGSSIKARLVGASGSAVWKQSWQYSNGNLRSRAMGSEKFALRAYQHRANEAIVPGSYKLLVEADGRGIVDREVVIRAGEIARELVQL